MWYPPYRSDLDPCGFFRFDYLKEQLKTRSYAEEEEVLSVLSELMSEIPPDMISRALFDWDRWLRLYILIKGAYVELSFILG
jgi:hypothetical protein